MLFNTMFSPYFHVLASKNDAKIELCFNVFRKRRFCENPYETLAARTKIKVRSVNKSRKIANKSIRKRTRKTHRKQFPKIRFFQQFWLPKTSQNRSKMAKNRSAKRCKAKPVSRRYGTCWQIVANQRKPSFVKRPYGQAYD